jgi:acetyl esterase/lipase
MATVSLSMLTSHALMLLALATPVLARAVELPAEKPLWPDTGWQNPIQYDVPETMSEHTAGKASLSGLNRVYSFVSKPTYSIHDAAPGTASGVGLVVCPGGGFRELWLDREGHDLALWLKSRGVTSLVLKYRTNTEGKDGKRKYSNQEYLPAVVADAREAIRILRAHLVEKNGNKARIGICGFSAGGALAMHSVFEPDPNQGTKQVNGMPDFAGLFYPGLRGADAQLIQKAQKIPPLFIINAIDDQTTPVGPCLGFYQLLIKAGAHAELHLYNQGGHGFDMGEGHGESLALWKESFVAWLHDAIGK